MNKLLPIAVSQHEDDQRLDKWLKTRYPNLTKVLIAKICRKGELRVDSKRVKPNFRVRVGQYIRVPPTLEKNGNKELNNQIAIEKALSAEDIQMIQNMVIFKDNYYLIINKPPGLPVQGGSKLQDRHIDFLSKGLTYELKTKPKLVHRLDKDTSGILVLARTPKAATEFGKLLKMKQVNKVYWALTAGVPRDLIGSISYGLVSTETGGEGEKMKCLLPEDIKGTVGAKSAQTNFVIIEKLGQRISWVGLSPVTGRKHQLRAHMAEIGSPILGDYKYGPKTQTNTGSGWGSRIGGDISRKLHLHARSVEFEHPFTRESVYIEADLPIHMKKSWDFFGWDLQYAPKDPFLVLQK